MTFNPMNFVTNLRYLAVGMVSIFAVIGVIILITVILNKIFTKKYCFSSPSGQCALQPLQISKGFYRRWAE